MSKLLTFSKLKVLSVVSVFLSLIFSLFLTTPVNSAEFVKPDDKGNISISDTANDSKNHTDIKENPYLFGNEIIVENSIEGDLLALGNNIEINTNVINGSVIIMGGEIDLKATQRIDNSVRIFAEKVTLEGNFYSDVLIFAKEVEITNARIAKDLVIGTENLSIDKKTSVFGDFKGEYNKYNGERELKEIVRGDIENLPDYGFKYKVGREVFEKAILPIFIMTKLFFWDLGIIILTILLTVFLLKKKRLENKEINFNKNFGYSALVSVLSIVIPSTLVLTFIFSLHGLLTLNIILSLMALSVIYLPIYLANLIKNAGKLNNVKTLYLVIGSYLFIFGIGLIPGFGGLIIGLLSVFNFGYLAISLFKTIKEKVCAQ